jgi:hypothetical protein
MKYKKIYSLPRLLYVLCFSAAVNEFSKYQKIKALDLEAFSTYDEHSRNYEMLIKEYVK